MTAEALPYMTFSRARPRRLWLWASGLVAALVVGTLANLFVLWPWMSSWGASKEEREAPLPGDELVPDPTIQATKGLTIRASPEAIYPWLLQIGVDRGGMYSYDWVENLFGLKVHTVDEIVPEFQTVQIGDFWRFTPKEYPLNPGPGLYVRELIPNRNVLLTFGMESKPDEAPIATWQFVLQPQADGTTRLLLRSRMAFEPQLPIKLSYFVQFIMERKMLYGIRERAERNAEP